MPSGRCSAANLHPRPQAARPNAATGAAAGAGPEPPAARARAALTRALSAAAPDREAAAAAAKARAAALLRRWSEDPESREALLAFGGRPLIDFLLSTACEDPSPEQAAAEGVLCDLLASRHCAGRILSRPSALPRLLTHVASGKATDQLAPALAAAAAAGAGPDSGGADGGGSGGGGSLDLSAAAAAASNGDEGGGGPGGGLQAEDARALVQLLNSRQGQQVRA
jgi:hypothetical protein